MAAWTEDELTAVADAEELEIASVSSDGSLRKPRTIWVVRLGDDLFVRSVNGPESAWFRGVRDRHEVRVSAGGIERDVHLDDADHDLDDQIDAAYRSKYGRYSENTLGRITSPEARSTSLTLVPRG
jgi:hypothetical protein